MAEHRTSTRGLTLAAAGLGVALALAAAGCSATPAPGTSAPGTSAPGATSTETAVTSAPTTTTRPPAPSLGALTTYGYGNSRSDLDSVDPAIGDLSSTPAWDDSLDGGVYGQPLVYDAIVYVGTENDTIDAIAASTGHVIWSLSVGHSVPTSVIDAAPTLSAGCGDISPLGITGTPVIDPAAKEIFVAEETEVGGDAWPDVQHWLVAVSLVSHRVLWHRQIDPPDGNEASDYYIPAEQQRPALTLLDGRIYVEMGGLNGDCGQYHGYVVDAPESGTGELTIYEVPTQREGAIWETGGALVSAAGNLYVATGNGSSNSISDYDEGNSVVELSPTLARIGYWAPGNWVQLNDEDWDLGSSGPVAVPGTSLLFVAGKPAADGSFGYLMSDAPLGGIGHGAFTGPVCLGGGAYGADATAVIGTGAELRTYVYVPCGSGTEAVEIDATAMTFTRAWAPSTGAPNGPPVVAGDLVWAVDWKGGELYGMDPSTGHVVVERSTGPLEHFATPAVGDARLFVPTQNGVEAWTTEP